ncbi:hypothetical protein ACQP3J_29785, partial [Escherichia coli]
PNPLGPSYSLPDGKKCTERLRWAINLASCSTEKDSGGNLKVSQTRQSLSTNVIALLFSEQETAKERSQKQSPA